MLAPGGVPCEQYKGGAPARRSMALTGQRATALPSSQKPFPVGLHSQTEVLIRKPFAALIHDACLQHRGRAWPVEIDPTRNIRLGHAASTADMLGHFARQRFDI